MQRLRTALAWCAGIALLCAGIWLSLMWLGHAGTRLRPGFRGRLYDPSVIPGAILLFLLWIARELVIEGAKAAFKWLSRALGRDRRQVSIPKSPPSGEQRD
jgi:hypothetical protein